MGDWQIWAYAFQIVSDFGPEAVSFVTQQVLDAGSAGNHDARDFWLDVTRSVVSLLEGRDALGLDRMI
jgi:hypothetical protein